MGKPPPLPPPPTMEGAIPGHRRQSPGQPSAAGGGVRASDSGAGWREMGRSRREGGPVGAQRPGSPSSPQGGNPLPFSFLPTHLAKRLRV